MSTDTYTLHLESRETVGTTNAQELRQSGRVPGTLYGPKLKAPVSVSVNGHDLTILLQHIEDTTLVDAELDGKTHKVLIKDIQANPLKSEIFAIDLYAPNLKEEIVAEVALDFVGESESEKEGNILIRNLTSVEVKALPTALPETITVDISALATLEDVVRAGDLTLDTGVELETDPEAVVALVEQPKQEEEPEMTSEELDAVEASQTESAEDASEEKTEE